MVLLVVAALVVGNSHRSASSAVMPTVAVLPALPFGTITSISSTTLTLTMQMPSMKSPVTYEVELAPGAVITEHTPKSAAEFAAGQEAYTPSASSTPPLPFDSKTISLSDLKTGMLVEVPSATKQNGVWQSSALIVDVLPAGASSTPALPTPPTAPPPVVPPPPPPPVPGR